MPDCPGAESITVEKPVPPKIAHLRADSLQQAEAEYYSESVFIGFDPNQIDRVKADVLKELDEFAKAHKCTGNCTQTVVSQVEQVKKTYTTIQRNALGQFLYYDIVGELFIKGTVTVTCIPGASAVQGEAQ